MNPHSYFKAFGVLALALTLFATLELLADQLSHVDPIRDNSTQVASQVADSFRGVTVSHVDAALQALQDIAISLFGTEQYKIELHNRTGISLFINSMQEGVGNKFTLADGDSHVFTSSRPGISISYNYQAVTNPGPLWQSSLLPSTATHTDADITIPQDYFTLTIDNHSGHTIDDVIIDHISYGFTLQNAMTYDMGAYPRHHKSALITCHFNDGVELTTSISPTQTSGTWSYEMVIPKREP